MSSAFPPDDDESEDAPFVAEVSDLRERHMAGHRVRSEPLYARRHSPRVRLVRAGGTLLVVVVALSVLLASLHVELPFIANSASQPAGARPLALVRAGDGITCLVDAEWSPDGRRLALLGYIDQYCSYYNTLPLPSTLVVYDVVNGRPLTTLHPDDTVLKALEQYAHNDILVSQVPGESPSVQYRHVAWTPDGRSLAVSFSTEDLPLTLLPGAVPAQLDGMALLPLDGKLGRTALALAPAYGTFAARWSVPAHVLTALDMTQTSPVLPVRYVWTDQGMLAWDGALSADPPSARGQADAVGQPEGGATFTPWQAGTIEPVARTQSVNGEYLSGEYLRDVFTYTTSVLAVSPRGTVLQDGVGGKVVLTLRGAPLLDSSIRALFALGTTPQVPVRDAGIRALLTDIGPRFDPRGIAVAWSPDGRTLAAFVPDDGLYPTVRLYDCQTGRRITSPPPITADQALLGVNDVLRWSPDGQRLFLFDVTDGVTGVWGPGGLRG